MKQARSPEPFGMWTHNKEKGRLPKVENFTKQQSQRGKSMTSEMTLRDTRKKHRHPIYKLRKGEEWNTMLEDIRDSYAGVYYSLNAFDVVSLFIPYEATRVSPEEQAQLEGE